MGGESLGFTVIGTVGALLILFGFYRTSIGRWKNRSFWYELDNTIGALLLIVYQWHLKAYVSVIVNAIWAIVAFRGLASFRERYRWARRKKRAVRP